ncbi:MAG: hypothetical protein QXZ44_05570 [Ferroplasma sp.]
MGLLGSYRRYKKAYKNYMRVMLDLISNKQHIKIIARNGKSSFWNQQKTHMYSLYIDNNLEGGSLDFFTFENSVIPGCMNFKYKSGQLFMCGMENNHNFLSTFGADEYLPLKVAGQYVIDIGSNVGDSPIYFTLNEAENVIAIPAPSFFNNMSQNIKVNDLEKRVNVINGTYAGKENDIVLKDLLNKYKIKSAVLKIDDINSIAKLLNEDNDTLRVFSRMQILYSGNEAAVKEKLESAGFKVSILPRKLKDANTDSKFIFAEQ